MKKAILTILLAALLIFAGQACVVSPTGGVLFTSTSHAINDAATGNTIGPGKVVRKGKSCSYASILYGIIFYGPGGSMAEAMKSSNITKVAIVERSSFSILGPLFVENCVVVWGE